jgi:hypothetical protein
MSGTRTPSRATASPADLERAWMHLLQLEWSSLALVPAHPSTSAQAVLEPIAELVRSFQMTVRIVQTEGCDVPDAPRYVQEVATAVAAKERVVVGVDSPLHNGAAIPILRAVDAAVVLVPLGPSDMSSIESLVDFVGRDRVLGSIALRTKDA